MPSLPSDEDEVGLTLHPQTLQVELTLPGV